MWLTQRILECLQENIATIITACKEQKEQIVIPTIILVLSSLSTHTQWCLRKCYDHIGLAPEFVTLEGKVLEKLLTLSSDAFTACGVDGISCPDCITPLTPLHLPLAHQARRALLSLSLRLAPPRYLLSFSSPTDAPRLSLQLATVPPPDVYCFSQDSEILGNIKRFYATLQAQRSPSAAQLQQSLAALLTFRSSNMLWSSAAVTLPRCCSLLHPGDPVNDMVVDSCFQYARAVSHGGDAALSAKKKEGETRLEDSRAVIDALCTALLATLPSNPAWVSRYIHQVLLYRRPHA